MKKAFVVLLFLPALSLLAIMAVSGEKEAWFDMENCEMCKPLMEQDPALLENMTWEHHEISNGLVSVSTVAPAFRAHYQKAGEQMSNVEKKLLAGDEVKLCNMCVAMGEMLNTGKVKMEHVMTSTGSIGLTTSDDPAMITEIQKWGERTTEEMKKMAETGQSE
ncbi:MAG: hypothetical protein JSU74_03820 [Candidatus Zixiibacteriota bacterium]|nr:MAG: hypothetical protein JSU74_03820 [candidate division Zixibacteria bacterium]